MQGLTYFIPTQKKAEYINLLLKVGFDTIDFGSFVSPQAIPQMKDTAEVLDKLDLSETNTELLAIVANIRGIQDATSHPQINYIGFPFSVSETFQQRNTNSTISNALLVVDELVLQCEKYDKTPVVYLSMGFGNPYGDIWNEEIVSHYAGILVEKGVKVLSLADTIGVANHSQIGSLFKKLTNQFSQIEIGVHLHSNENSWQEKINAAYVNGCRRFDTTIKGYGGCPMALDELTGNIATENVIAYLTNKGENLNLQSEAWIKANQLATEIFH